MARIKPTGQVTHSVQLEATRLIGLYGPGPKLDAKLEALIIKAGLSGDEAAYIRDRATRPTNWPQSGQSAE